MQEPTKYEIRMANWGIEEDADCPNYQLAKFWAISNGYRLKTDVSYNGFIELEKTFNLTEDPFDGNSIEVKVYNGKNPEKHHCFIQLDMEAEFGDIMDTTKYRLKYAKVKNGSSSDLATLLAEVLVREQFLISNGGYYENIA